MNFALPIGLAQTVNYEGKINDLHYNELAMKRVKDEQEAKAKMFADDTDYTNAMNSFDNPVVKQFANAKIKEIGSFVNANPDWQSNVNKRIQYKQLIRELKDNPDLNRGVASDKSYSEFQKDLAEKSKHPELLDAGAYDEVKKQWDNYTQYGNQFGKEAAEKEGKKAFTYTAPKDFTDLTQAGLEYGNKFGDFKIESLPGGGPGSYREVPKEESLNASTLDFYHRNERQINLEAQRKSVSPIDYAKNLIKAGIKTKFDYGNMDVAYKWAHEKGEIKAPEGVWSRDIVGQDKSSVNGEILQKVLGVSPKIKIRNSEGDYVDLTGNDVTYTGRNVYMGNDRQNNSKHFEITTKGTVEDALAKGILKNKSTINPKWKGKAYLKDYVDKDGKTQTEVVYNDFVPFELNNTYQGVYDQVATINKYVEQPNDNSSEQTGTYNGAPAILKGGHIYDLKGNLLK